VIWDHDDKVAEIYALFIIGEKDEQKIPHYADGDYLPGCRNDPGRLHCDIEKAYVNPGAAAA